MAIVPVTAMPYAALSALEFRKESTSTQAADHQRLVDLGNVDLARLVLGGVDDLHARRVAELDALLREGERPRDQRLRRDDRRRGGDDEQRPLKGRRRQQIERDCSPPRDRAAGARPGRSS